MQQFNTFYIHSSEYFPNQNLVVFHYSFDKKEYFHEEIHLPENHKIIWEELNIVKNILFHVSIAFGISYYKLFPTQKIIVDSWKLDIDQKDYWKDFYIQWLWEFFYTNQIDFTQLCNFESIWAILNADIDFSFSEKYLLPIGGWKDSIVSSIILEEQKIESTPFIFWKMDYIKEWFLKIYGQDALLITRQIDPKLFEMNTEWYYNGHVPITWLISYFMTLICYLYDYKYIIFSNEKSANIWNTTLWELEINHQYSKSLDFENKISHYISKHISSEIQYNSILRDKYEIEIAKIFAEKWKKYFSVFSSCNTNFSMTKHSSNRWCNTCPKCLFVYIILRPFLTHDETLEIFSEELYSRKDLLPLFKEIVWLSGIKPFECVWEIEEAQLWVYLSRKKYWPNLPILLEYFSQNFNEYENIDYFLRLEKKYNLEL